MQRTKYNNSRQNAAESLGKSVIIARNLNFLPPLAALVRRTIGNMSARDRFITLS
jgi:hypothetical protein